MNPTLPSPSWWTGKQIFGCFYQVFWSQWWKVISTRLSCIWWRECATLCTSWWTCGSCLLVVTVSTATVCICMDVYLWTSWWTCGRFLLLVTVSTTTVCICVNVYGCLFPWLNTEGWNCTERLFLTLNETTYSFLKWLHIASPPATRGASVSPYRGPSRWPHVRSHRSLIIPTSH